MESVKASTKRYTHLQGDVSGITAELEAIEVELSMDMITKADYEEKQKELQNILAEAPTYDPTKQKEDEALAAVNATHVPEVDADATPYKCSKLLGKRLQINGAEVNPILVVSEPFFPFYHALTWIVPKARVTDVHMAEKRFIALYFSAHWCLSLYCATTCWDWGIDE